MSEAGAEKQGFRPGAELWWILIGAAALRIVMVLGAYAAVGSSRAFMAPDTTEYLASARELWLTGRFTVNGVPELLRTPGYPLLLLPGYALHHVVAVTLAGQVLLSVATVYLAAQLALQLTGDRRGAVAAAALLAIEPLAFTFPAQLLTETVFAFTTTALFCLLVTAARSRRLGPVVAVGLVLVAAIAIRPIALLLPVVLVPCYFVVWLRQGHSLPQTVLRLGLLGLVTLVPVMGWQARNRAVAGYPGLTSLTDYHMYFWNAAGLLAYQEGVSLEEMQARLGNNNVVPGANTIDPAVYFALHPEQAAWTEVQRLAWQGREGRRIIREHLLVYTWLHLKGMARTLLGGNAGHMIELFGLTPHPPSATARLVVLALRVVTPLDNWLYLALALVGLACVRRTEPAAGASLVAVAVFALWFGAGGPAGYSRLRLPFEVPLCVFAGAGLVYLRERLRAAPAA